MGSFLSSPVELMRVQRHGSAGFRCAVAEMQGWRVGHEDAHEMWCDNTSAAFWVLDGHAGDGASIFGAPELLEEFKGDLADSLPTDERLEQGFTAVDERLRNHIAKNPQKDSGSTVVGALASRASDGTYSVKLLNCGDSRGLIVRGPEETKATAAQVPVRIPQHLEALTSDLEAVARGEAPKPCPWPLVAESIDHKPNHPTEMARIKNADGYVSAEDPPRLDGNLAVSRGIGDFEYKGASSRPVQEQKVSCIPDVYEVSGLPPGSVLVLGCDGVWDVMTGEYVATFVHDWLKRQPDADLGEIAAQIIRDSLERNSRDNVSVMIAHLVDGSDWASEPDEMKNYEKLAKQTDFDDQVRKGYLAFLQRTAFPAEPCPCDVCGQWRVSMSQCQCKQVYYCKRECQKKGWKAHKPKCSAAIPAASAPAKAGKDGGKK